MQQLRAALRVASVSAVRIQSRSAVNKAILVGHVGRDPEVRNFSNGGSVTTFPLATSETFTDRAGNKQSKTEWHNVAVYNAGLQTIVQNYVTKGRHLYVEGAISSRQYEDASGTERVFYEIAVGVRGAIELLGSRSSGNAPPGQSPSHGSPNRGTNAFGRTSGSPGSVPGHSGNDDLPF